MVAEVAKKKSKQGIKWVQYIFELADNVPKQHRTQLSIGQVDYHKYCEGRSKIYWNGSQTFFQVQTSPIDDLNAFIIVLHDLKSYKNL